MHVTGAWSRERVERFLREATIPVRIACRTPGPDDGTEGHAPGRDESDPTEGGDRTGAESGRDATTRDPSTEEWSPGENSGLWMLSLWYRYGDGALWCATSADADVVGYLEADPSVAFEVSTNDPPYRGVRGRGTASVAPDPDKELLRALLERYLGGTDSDLAARLLRPEREEVRIRIDLGRVYSWDYTERMRGV